MFIVSKHKLSTIKPRNINLCRKCGKPLPVFIRIQEKDEKVRSVEASLQAALNNESERKKVMKVSVLHIL